VSHVRSPGLADGAATRSMSHDALRKAPTERGKGRGFNEQARTNPCRDGRRTQRRSGSFCFTMGIVAASWLGICIDLDRDRLGPSSSSIRCRPCRGMQKTDRPVVTLGNVRRLIAYALCQSARSFSLIGSKVWLSPHAAGDEGGKGGDALAPTEAPALWLPLRQSHVGFSFPVSGLLYSRSSPHSNGDEPRRSRTPPSRPTTDARSLR